MCKYIFLFLVDVSIANSYILHKTYSPPTCTKYTFLKSFRLELAKGLIEIYNSRKRSAPITPRTIPRPQQRPIHVAYFHCGNPLAAKRKWFAPGIALMWEFHHKGERQSGTDIIASYISATHRSEENRLLRVIPISNVLIMNSSHTSAIMHHNNTLCTTFNTCT